MAMLLPLLALDLLLSVMTDSIQAVHALLGDEFLSRLFAIGIVNDPEFVEGGLAASLGCNPPMSDSDFVVARIVFDASKVVTRVDATSQCTNAVEESFTIHVLANTATSRVATSNVRARFRRTEFDCLDVTIKCFEIVFGQSKRTFHEEKAEVTQSVVIILQSSRFDLANIIIRGDGWSEFSAKWARNLAVLPFDQSLIFCITCGANHVPTADPIG